MTLFIFSVVTVIVVSAMCSLSEASIYAVRRPFIRTLTDSGSLAGPVLESFKDNMERPIAAILIVNTAANTAGASIAGAQASALFGPRSFLWFSVFFTLGVLVLSEIFPKILGVVYSRPIAKAAALPWKAAIAVLAPVVWAVERLSTWLKPSGQVFAAPEEEVMQFARISADEGSISDQEATMVRNVLKLNDLSARDVMTPRTVVFRLPATMTLGDVHAHVDNWTHSRIPIFDPDDAERWTGMVRATDILNGLAHGRSGEPLSAIALPLPFVVQTTRAHLLLNRFLEERTHLFGVADEFGGVAGVVSLEDVVESLIGDEIVDEVDQEPDLREAARRRARRRTDPSEPETGPES